LRHGLPVAGTRDRCRGHGDRVAETLAYAIWAAAGVALVAIIGALFLNETLNWTMGAGLLLVIAGVVLLELGRSH
jgi:multidrug transporter EmrE-like cation transporter